MAQIIYGMDLEWIPFVNTNIIRDNFQKIVSTLLEMNPKAAIGFVNDRS